MCATYELRVLLQLPAVVLFAYVRRKKPHRSSESAIYCLLLLYGWMLNWLPYQALGGETGAPLEVPAEYSQEYSGGRFTASPNI